MDLTKNINIMQDFQYAINIAYDINSDDKISSADYVKIRKYIMNGGGLWKK